MSGCISSHGRGGTASWTSDIVSTYSSRRMSARLPRNCTALMMSPCCRTERRTTARAAPRWKRAVCSGRSERRSRRMMRSQRQRSHSSTTVTAIGTKRRQRPEGARDGSPITSCVITSPPRRAPRRVSGALRYDRSDGDLQSVPALVRGQPVPGLRRAARRGPGALQRRHPGLGAHGLRGLRARAPRRGHVLVELVHRLRPARDGAATAATRVPAGRGADRAQLGPARAHSPPLAAQPRLHPARHRWPAPARRGDRRLAARRRRPRGRPLRRRDGLRATAPNHRNRRATRSPTERSRSAQGVVDGYREHDERAQHGARARGPRARPPSSSSHTWTRWSPSAALPPAPTS